jgi:uncharacterized protein (TIGR02145 family)
MSEHMKKLRLTQFLLIIILLFIYDCRKKEEIPEKPTNLTATIISQTEIDLSWVDNSDNETGFRIERSQNGGTDWTTVSSTSADVAAYKNSGLLAGSSYSFKVMAFNSAGNSGYSNIVSGNTPAAIVYSRANLSTSAISDITQNSATGGGNITGDGNSPVLARGVCWSTTAEPTVENTKTSDGGGTGSFSSSITGLSAGTQYYARAYATNSTGTAYGEQVTFTTLAPLPVVATLTTTAVTSVTSYSAAGGGNITADGGAEITSRGICWSTTADPTIANDTTKNGSGTGSFSGNLKGLSGNTQYYVRAYATNSAGTAYGNQVTFTTSAPSAFVPDLATTAVSSITATSAISGGNITSDKGLAVTARGICWSTSPSPTIAHDTTLSGSGTGSFVSNIKGLTPNTKYYIRAYATNSQGTGYGDEKTITTENVTPPVAASVDATSISATSATLNGSVNANGTATTITFEYGTTTFYGTSIDATPVTATGITPVSALAIATGLTPNTLYHFRVKAVSVAGTVYGDDLTFTTLTLPSATTMTAQYVFPTSATLTGYVNANGNTTSIKFEYGKTTSYGSILLGIPDNANGTTDVPSRVDLTGLTKSTNYHFRIIAENRAGITYGEDKTFTTPENDPVIPALTTSAVTEITYATATGGGNITNDGGGEIIARGICYSTTPSPTLDDSKTINGTGTGVFTSPFTGLAPNTVYYVRAYATNFVGTAYGSEVTFTSAPPPAELPVVSTAPVSEKTHEGAKSGGDVTDDGGGAITAKGVCWSTGENPTILDSRTDEGAGSGSYVSNIAGLDPGTLYYVRAYATNSAGTAYGEAEVFVTNAPPAGFATLTTTAGSDITNSSATSGGNITNDGGGAITERGVCWSTTANPTITGSKTSDGSGTGAFSSAITGLSPSTLYYVRAYATNEAGTAYGNQVTFTTLAPDPVLPTVTTAAVTGITYNSGSGGGNVTHSGYADVTARGICWSTSANPTTSNSSITIGNGTGTFTGNMSSLNFSTTYYVRAWATNSVGTAYGNEVSFTTSPLPYSIPSLTTKTATSVTDNSAFTGGDIISNGGDPISAKGVCYGTSTNPTLANNFTSNGTGSESFISALTDLSANTTYYVKAYATNAAGTAYGDEKSFTTPVLPGAPALTTTDASSIGTTTATSGGNITDDGDGVGGPHTITAKGVCWSTSANPTTANSKTSDGTGTGSYSSSLTGLTPCTTYHIRAYATNSAGKTAYGADKTFTTGSVLPTVSTTSLTSQTTTSVSTGGTVSGSCASTVTERGVCWSTSSGPTTSGSKLTSGTGSGSYTISITGLTPCTTYYIRSYAINASGTQYGDQLSFTTSTATSTVSTTDISSITSTSASTGGTVSGVCTSGVTRGICYGLAPNPTTSGNVIAAGTTGAGSYAISITGLIPCTTYYVRAYVTNSAGTSYGAQKIFTTGVSSPTITTTAASGITATTASSGGTISGNCASSVIERGVCWNTTGTPTTANSKTTSGSGSGTYTSTITGLTRLTTYYVRAYVVIGTTTYYGNQISFSTIAAVPTVSTSTISTTITNTSTTGGGNVSSDGGASVTARGVCWSSTSSSPTTADPKTTDATGTGSFTSSITGLSAGTTYYVRAYATNSSGTAYGAFRSFTTPATLTDYDNNTYSTISYNGNVWMQSNLRVTHYKNGTSMWQASDTSQFGGYAYYHSYDDNSINATDYGYMYGGYAVNSNICPTGWHVPTQSEWKTLGDFIGGGTNYYQYAADKMKQYSAVKRSGMSFVLVYFWNSGMTGDNSSLFYARGGGYYDGWDQGLKESTRWWTGTSLRYVRIDRTDDMLYGVASNLQGYSDQAYYIRCKKD